MATDASARRRGNRFFGPVHQRRQTRHQTPKGMGPEA